MVRSTAISWTIALAIAALALPLSQLPASAEDAQAEAAETPSQPLEPRLVHVILLPPADDALFASPSPEQTKTAPVVLVKPVGTAAIAQPGAEPATVPEDDVLFDNPSLPDRRPRVASLPDTGNPAIASRGPEPEQAQNAAAPVVIPSFPERSPFRQAAFKSEVVESAPRPEAAPAKGNAASRFLAKLWPGNKPASAPVPPAAQSTQSPAASAPAEQRQADAEPKSDKPPIKRLLDGLQFWKN
jgi:hypothetical protein